MEQLLIFLLPFFIWESSIEKEFDVCMNRFNYFLEQDNVQPNNGDVFIVFTSNMDTTLKEGVFKRVTTTRGKNCEVYITSYTFFAEKKEFDIKFSRIDMIYPDSVQKRESKNPLQCTVHRDFLKNVKLIDLDRKQKIRTKEEFQEFRDRLINKCLWLIDRNDMTRDSVNLQEMVIPIVLDRFPDI